MTLPKSAHAGIMARIKILSNLKLDEHRLPQDGRFKIKNQDYQVAFRVSIIPAFDGEKAVLRLLPDTAQQLSLEQLGFQPQSYEIVKRNISKPHGMILVTGPTGSGKTTTLYTILQILNKPEVNISTVEDPVEYKMPGINQCQVQPKIGFTFASALRAFLRQDPNIILVGEIRDNETADIAINAAMTGHLVLSTLHTNDAATTIPRLTDMQIPTFLIASTLNLVIAQRLVRKICKNCIESYKLDKRMIDELEKQFNIPELEKNLVQLGYLPKGQKLTQVLFYRGRGCQQCDNSGYKGRLGIYETLEVDETISELITKRAEKEEIHNVAVKNGMLTIVQDGFIKAKQGITTIEEVLRVTKE
jgi:type IV pilus assembly protein PilB